MSEIQQLLGQMPIQQIAQRAGVSFGGGRYCPWSARVVSIGPVTSATARESGIRVDVDAERHDIDGLVEALLADAA